MNAIDVAWLWGELIEQVKSRIDLANLLGLIGGVFYIATLYMKTMVPLRAAAIASNIFFIGYGFFSRSFPTFALYVVMFPLNCVRLYQIMQLVKRVKKASQGDLSMDWLKPFMTKRNFREGQVIFRKGDVAEEMFFTVSGKFRVTEIGVELPPGHIVGEMGLLAPDNRRTQSLECVESGQMLTITYDKVRELYFQDPEFGFYFLRLTTERLLQNIARLEKVIEDNKISASAEATEGSR
jgi:hypothetical protein